MATKRGDNVATGTKARETTLTAEKGTPAVADATTGQVEGVDIAALQAELAEMREAQAQTMRAMMALLEKQATAEPSGQRAKQDVEPAKDDPRRPDVAEEGFEPVVFRSKGKNQRIVRVPATRWTTLNGEAQHAGGIAYNFEPNGEFVAKSENVAEFLRRRPMFNVEFWEVGNEPHTPPDPSLMLDKILKATMELDLDTLEELRAAEAASHGRKIVLDQITAAQRRIKAA
jgi:hypothetical protein